MPEYVEHGGAQVLGEVQRDFRRLGARARSEHDRRQAVGRVITAMHERIDRPFALEEMARIAYLSPFYFHRVFRQLTGVPPGRFHTALRIAAAKRLLLTSCLSVTEVCFEVGYQSLGTFTTHFHELVGVSPREFRALVSRPWGDPAELAAGLASAADDGGPPAVHGRVPEAAEDRVVFVGLFSEPYPQRLPVACTVVLGPGSYALWTPRAGRFHVAAAAFARSGDARGWLLPDQSTVLVATMAPAMRLAPGSRAVHDVRLRPVRETDPPILLAVPFAAAAAAARTGAAVHAGATAPA